MDDEIRNSEQIEYLLRSLLPSRFIANFIVIAEVVDGDSSELTVTVSNALTPWCADGMLTHAKGIISSGDLGLGNGKDIIN